MYRKPARFQNYLFLCLVPAMILLAAMAMPAAAQNPEAEENYKRFLAIYRQEKPTKTELGSALSFLETANLLAPNTYKYVFSLGAVNSSLERWDTACSWLEKAQALAATEGQKEQIHIELEYCQAKLAQLRVNAWGAPGISISFIMKEGTLEMDKQTIDRLPQRLPVVPVGHSTLPIEDTLRRSLINMNVRWIQKDRFLIVDLKDGTAPEAHYEKGIKDFYQYFKAQYFADAPQRVLVVIISSAPFALVEATRRLYPEVNIPVYAPFLGYYNPADNLIMATGGAAGYGTLLHEMIHALVAADFAAAPPWLNEGLASLYERTQWTSGRLKALPNWRLDGMREDAVPTLQTLAQTAPKIGLHTSEIGLVRLFLLFLEERQQVDDLYRMAKKAGPAFSLEEVLREFRLKEDDWRTFVKNTFRDYRAEIAQGRGVPSNPDEVRFIQQALNRILGADLKVDGIWGSTTLGKLVEFQSRFQLKPDGVPGRETLGKLRREYNLLQVESL